MQTTINTSIRGPFHKTGISFGNAGAIVRMDHDHKITACVASWLRTRSGPVDQVFVTSPQALAGPADNIIEMLELTGAAAKPRLDLFIYPDETVMDLLAWSTTARDETATGPAIREGYWAVLNMNRMVQSPEYATMVYKLDAGWRKVIDSCAMVPRLADFLHADFLQVAASTATAWPILFAASTLFGGQDPEEMPVTSMSLPEDLVDAVQAERRFRNNQRRARAMRPEDADAFKAKLDPAQLEAFAALMEGRRSHA